jgi:ribulose-phosphate 3-epimerase
MSVNPGWGAQELIPASLQKLARMRAALPDRVALEVDGGVHQGTVQACVEAGAEVLVTGSAVFGSPDPTGAYTELAELAEAL